MITQQNRDVRSLFHVKEISLIGKSPAMARVVNSVEKFASVNCNVLILGPNGTGKELVARMIHDRSNRSAGPFIAVNCAALPSTIMESEFFGAAKGAYTGAFTPRMGYFEAANGGTIFLDEIGDMPLTAQAKLLRALQEKLIRRLGENLDRPTDFRIVAATNQDLEAACSEHRFREDLYYRLAVTIIQLPPLGERAEDIPLLVKHFLKKHTKEIYGAGHETPKISDEAMDALMRHSFPGNVRELENLVRRALILSDGELIRVENLPQTILGGLSKDFTALVSQSAPSAQFLEALRAALFSQYSRMEKIRTRSIRIAKLEDIARYLTETSGRDFSRKEFEVFLRRMGRRGMNQSAYQTAGRYLRAMIRKGVIEHNGGRANKSRFRVSRDLLED